jgi:hypothetical protein
MIFFCVIFIIVRPFFAFIALTSPSLAVIIHPTAEITRLAPRPLACPFRGMVPRRFCTDRNFRCQARKMALFQLSDTVFPLFDLLCRLIGP